MALLSGANLRIQGNESLKLLSTGAKSISEFIKSYTDNGFVLVSLISALLPGHNPQKGAGGV